MKRLLLATVAWALLSAPAFAQVWDQVGGSMQVRSGTTTPLVIIDQTNTSTNNKILSLRANGTEKCSVDIDGDLVCAGTLSLTGQFLAGNGSVSAPSYSFSSSPTSGWYSPGTNEVAAAIGGAALFDLFASNIRLTNTTILGWASGDSTATSTDVALSRGAPNVLTLANGNSFSIGGAPAAATTAHRLIKKVTGIADAVATDVVTVTVPNAAHAAGIKLSFLSSNGSTDAFESSRVAEGFVVLARTAGVATVAAVAALDLAQIATVAAGATHTLAYGVSAMSGAAGATQTFTIQVTINDSGNVGSNQIVVVAEVINAEATGVTIQ